MGVQQCLQQGRLFNMTPRCELAFEAEAKSLMTLFIRVLVTDLATIYHSLSLLLRDQITTGAFLLYPEQQQCHAGKSAQCQTNNELK